MLKIELQKEKKFELEVLERFIKYCTFQTVVDWSKNSVDYFLGIYKKVNKNVAICKLLQLYKMFYSSVVVTYQTC